MKRISMLFLFNGIFFLSDSAYPHAGNQNTKGYHNNVYVEDYKHVQNNFFTPRSSLSLNRDTITGIPRITDGDSIRIGNIRIRLHGIDAPEARQTCMVHGEKWRCGWEATNALANIIGKHWVTCKRKDLDRYGRIVALCKVGPIDLSAWMVGNGWALAYRRYSKDYIADEKHAKTRRLGMWRGEFMMPWIWRRRYN